MFCYLFGKFIIFMAHGARDCFVANRVPIGAGTSPGYSRAPESILVPRLSWAEEGTPERQQGNEMDAADSGCMVPYNLFRAEPLGAFGSSILP